MTTREVTDILCFRLQRSRAWYGPLCADRGCRGRRAQVREIALCLVIGCLRIAIIELADHLTHFDCVADLDIKLFDLAAGAKPKAGCIGSRQGPGAVGGQGPVVAAEFIPLVLLAIIVGLVYSLAIWLFSRTSTDPEKQNPRSFLILIVTRLREILFSFRRGAVRKVRRYGEAVRLYTALRTWGRRSGLPHFLNETPTEYGLRLQSRFPVFESEIELIVQAFNREVYGQASLSEQQMATTRFAWRNLSSPLHWPSRLKTRFLLK